MLIVGMATSLAGYFDIERWRTVGPYIRALLAYRKCDFATALKSFERAMRPDSVRTTEHMAFLAQLMVLNQRPPKQYLDLFKRVVAGEFRENDGSPYAKAYAQYWMAYLLSLPDVMKWWMDAYALKPKNGWASRFLTLPDNPFLDGSD